MILGLRETQGKTGSERIRTSLEKVWPGWSCWVNRVPPPDTGESRWPGPACGAMFLCQCSRPPETTGHARALVLGSEGCRELISRLRLPDQRATMSGPEPAVPGVLTPSADSLSPPAISLQLPLPRQLTAVRFKERKGSQLFECTLKETFRASHS